MSTDQSAFARTVVRLPTVGHDARLRHAVLKVERLEPYDSRCSVGLRLRTVAVCVKVTVTPAIVAAADLVAPVIFGLTVQPTLAAPLRVLLDSASHPASPVLIVQEHLFDTAESVTLPLPPAPLTEIADCEIRY
jgi:hypothetical protein